MESCSTAAWPMPMSVIMDSTSALWPCNTTSRLQANQKHSFTPQRAWICIWFWFWKFVFLTFWPSQQPLQQPQNHTSYLSKVFILILSLRTSSFAARASLCCDSKYVIWVYVGNKNSNQKRITTIRQWIKTISIFTLRAEHSFSFSIISFCKFSKAFLCSSTVSIKSSIAFCFSRQSRSGIWSDTRWIKVAQFNEWNVPGSQLRPLTFRAKIYFHSI